ncbi:MAG: class I tRNA ligase family protein [Methanolobus sp.]
MHTSQALRAINEFVLEDLQGGISSLSGQGHGLRQMTSDKLAVYRVLYDVFVLTAKVIAPFMPHLAEETEPCQKRRF